jgi:hypothetical protein
VGLDIKFNLSAAVIAGMAIRTETIGDKEAIAMAEKEYAENAYPTAKEFLDWVSSTILVATIPEYIESFVVDAFENDAVIRANKWGSLYKPLTSFLEVNNIPWEEF